MYENCRMPLFPKGRSGILANGKEKMDWIFISQPESGSFMEMGIMTG